MNIIRELIRAFFKVWKWHGDTGLTGDTGCTGDTGENKLHDWEKVYCGHCEHFVTKGYASSGGCHAPENTIRRNTEPWLSPEPNVTDHPKGPYELNEKNDCKFFKGKEA